MSEDSKKRKKIKKEQRQYCKKVKAGKVRPHSEILADVEDADRAEDCRRREHKSRITMRHPIKEHLTRLTLAEIEEEIKIRNDLLSQMVGRLYPSIIQDEIELLLAREKELIGVKSEP